MAVVTQLGRLVKITQTMVKRRKKMSPSRGLTSGGPQPSVGSTAITTHTFSSANIFKKVASVHFPRFY